MSATQLGIALFVAILALMAAQVTWSFTCPQGPIYDLAAPAAH